MGGGKRNAWVLLTILAPEIRVRVTREACLIPVSLTKAPIQVPAGPSASLWNGIFQSPRKRSHSCVRRAPPSLSGSPILPLVFAAQLWEHCVKFSLWHAGNTRTHFTKKTESGAFLGAGGSVPVELIIHFLGTLTTPISGTFLMTSTPTSMLQTQTSVKTLHSCLN